MKKLRVLVLMHPDHVPPDSLDGLTAQEALALQAEFDIVQCLRKLGHEARPLGVQDEFLPIRDAVEEFKPHIVFNLLEEFHNNVLFDQNVVSLLELLRVPYTGCNPRGLILARSKSLSKKLLAYHRIPVPDFLVIPRGHRTRRPKKLEFPLFVKSLMEHASYGIAQASLVEDDERLAERVAFVHESIGTDAIAERFIEGREIYVGVLGNERLVALPPLELVFENRPANAPLIATAKAKHDLAYQAKRGIVLEPAEGLEPEVAERIARFAKRIYRTLELDGYARIDFRLSSETVPYFLDANPNPDISDGEELASAAELVGMTYGELISRILRLGMRRGAGGR
ncbi:MAG: D-alanine--D-alanine ligase family protein [Gemmatimonadaceae bacterium]